MQTPGDDAVRDTLRLRAVELRRVSLPLVTPFRTASASLTERDVLLVRVEGEGERGPTAGWGECVALPEPTYTAEYVDGAHHLLRTHLVPVLLAARSTTADRVASLLAGVHGHAMAKAALELAVLDAELRDSATSLATRLGAVRTEVECGVSIGMFPVAELIDHVDRYVAEGYRRVKLKIEPGAAVAPVAAVRDRHPDVVLQVDANGTYARSDVDELVALDSFDLAQIEQPLPPDDLLGHASLGRRLRTPVCLDESITSARVAQQAIELGACAVVNVKPGRVGGLFEAVRVHDVCLRAGVPVWCGGMLETGIGRAANLALAGLPGFSLPGDLSASDRYYVHDVVTDPFRLHDGKLTVPSGPGIGVTLDRAFLDEITTAVERIEP